MNIAIDSTVFVADPWLRSQGIRLLLHYLRSTRSDLILVEPVEIEVAAHFERLFRAEADALGSAVRRAERLGLEQLTPVDANSVASVTFRKWQQRNAEVLGGVSVCRVPLDNSILPEAIRRATQRVPPCDENGKQLRDTIIWLTLLGHCRATPNTEPVAFISGNKTDFAEPGGTVLKSQLRQDAGEIPVDIQYFSTLEDFNKVHAEPLAHITVDWVNQHLARSSIADLVRSHLELHEPRLYFRVTNMDYEDYYEPRETAAVFDPDVTVTDVYVWAIGPRDFELSIHFDVDVEADIECDLTQRPSQFWRRSFEDDLDDDYPSSKTITCFGQLSGVVAARVENGDSVTLVGLEELVER